MWIRHCSEKLACLLNIHYGLEFILLYKSIANEFHTSELSFIFQECLITNVNPGRTFDSALLTLPEMNGQPQGHLSWNTRLKRTNVTLFCFQIKHDYYFQKTSRLPKNKIYKHQSSRGSCTESWAQW
jgi:hypothetical protein